MTPLELLVLDGEYAVWKPAPGSEAPVWEGRRFLSVTRTPEELSVVSLADHVLPGAEVEAGWACLQVKGPLSFELTGVLAALSGPLAEAEIPIFVVSTFDTDYILVHGKNLDRAREVLEAAGHMVSSSTT